MPPLPPTPFAGRYYLVAVAAWLASPALSLAETVNPASCAIAQYETLSAYHELSNSPKEEKLKLNLTARNTMLSDCIQSVIGQLSPDNANRLKKSSAGMSSDLTYNLAMLQKTGASPGQPLASMVNNALETANILAGQNAGTTPQAHSLRQHPCQ